MRTRFIYLLLTAAVSGSAAAQDTLSLDDYRLRVLQYSYTLKQAAEQTRAALDAMHLPELDYFMEHCAESFSMTLDELE